MANQDSERKIEFRPSAVNRSLYEIRHEPLVLGTVELKKHVIQFHFFKRFISSSETAFHVDMPPEGSNAPVKFSIAFTI